MTLFPGSGYQPLHTGHVDYADLSRLEEQLLKAVGGQQLFEEKLRSFFRSAIDEVIDTARTGRFTLAELEKTEKTYLGTKFEMLLREWLQVPRGQKLDLLIGGEEVDVKSTTLGGSGWMIPREAFDQLCILLRVNEKKSHCGVGLVRARIAYLRAGINQDKKKGFSAAGVENIWWLAHDLPYTPNFWTQIDKQLRSQIMTPRGGKMRLAAMFENCLETPVSRVLIASIAAQDDFMKRIRRNGGARDILAPKGIAILYANNDRALMEQLGLTFGTREFVSYLPRNDAEATLLRNAGHID